MKAKQFDEFWGTDKQPSAARMALRMLIRELIPSIRDEYRATDDPSDDIPAMQITISCNEDCTRWSYQTGDNSFTGSCYGDPYWGIGTIFRDSEPREVADELIEDLARVIDFDYEE